MSDTQSYSASIAERKLSADDYKQVRYAIRILDRAEKDMRNAHECGVDCREHLVSWMQGKAAFQWLEDTAFDQAIKDSVIADESLHSPPEIPSVLPNAVLPGQKAKILDAESQLRRLHPLCDKLRDGPFPCPEYIERFERGLHDIEGFRNHVFPYIVEPMSIPNANQNTQ